MLRANDVITKVLYELKADLLYLYEETLILITRDSQRTPIELSDNGFHISLKAMEKGKRYTFNFMDSEYEAIKNEKEELILSEVG